MSNLQNTINMQAFQKEFKLTQLFLFGKKELNWKEFLELNPTDLFHA